MKPASAHNTHLYFSRALDHELWRSHAFSAWCAPLFLAILLRYLWELELQVVYLFLELLDVIDCVNICLLNPSSQFRTKLYLKTTSGVSRSLVMLGTKDLRVKSLWLSLLLLLRSASRFFDLYFTSPVSAPAASASPSSSPPPIKIQGIEGLVERG